LSDDDLLEIIGQAKDPRPINKHIKKIFEGVNELESQHEGKGGSKQYVITKVLSIEKEEIELGNRSVPVDQKVETWLEKLRLSIAQSLRKLFQKFWIDSLPIIQKKVPAKEAMGKIIHTSKGQCLICMTQIEWTSQVSNALISMSSGSLDANPLKKVKNLYKKKTELLIECVEKQGLAMVDRIKIIALIIIEEHNREVIEKLNMNKSVTDEKSFEWTSQLRFSRI
jgi:dynein heavy chain